MPVYAAAYWGELVGQWPLILIASVGCLAGTVVGKRTLDKVPQSAFRGVVCAVLIAMGGFRPGPVRARLTKLAAQGILPEAAVRS
jgi:uncharacterized membrane protein YfcA